MLRRDRTSFPVFRYTWPLRPIHLAAILKTLSVISDIRVLGEVAFRNSKQESEWEYTTTLYPSSASPSEGEVPESVDIPANAVGLRVRPASLSKCPRCWTFTREEQADLCARCDDAVRGPSRRFSGLY